MDDRVMSMGQVKVLLSVVVVVVVVRLLFLFDFATSFVTPPPIILPRDQHRPNRNFYHDASWMTKATVMTPRQLKRLDAAGQQQLPDEKDTRIFEKSNNCEGTHPVVADSTSKYLSGLSEKKGGLAAATSSINDEETSAAKSTASYLHTNLRSITTSSLEMAASTLNLTSSRFKSVTSAASSRMAGFSEKGTSANAKTSSLNSTFNGIVKTGRDGVRYVANATSSGLKSATTGVQSAATSTTSTLTGLSEMGSAGMKYVANAANSGFNDAATGVQSATTAAKSTLSGLAEKGSAGVNYVANATDSSLNTAATGVRSATTAAKSTLSGLAEKGTAGAQYLANATNSAATSTARSVAFATTSTLAGIADQGSLALSSVASNLRELAANDTSSSLPSSTGTGVATARPANTASTTLPRRPTEVVVNDSYQSMIPTTKVDDYGVSAVTMDDASGKAKTKALVLGFTGKDKYKFGDMADELIRRMKAFDTKATKVNNVVNIQDMILLLKVLIALGVSFGPLAKLIPLTMLVDMLNTSLEAQLGTQIIQVLAECIDDRITAAFTSEQLGAIVLGDITKRTILQSILAFTGKQSYEFGDIVDTIFTRRRDGRPSIDNDTTTATTAESTTTASKFTDKLELSAGQLGKIEEWDKNVRRNINPDYEKEDLGTAVATTLSEAGIGIIGPSADYLSRLDVQITSELDQLEGTIH